MREWVITKIDGKPVNKRQPAKPSSSGRMRQKGAGERLRKQRQRQLEADLAKQRRERLYKRLEAISRGEAWDRPRSHDGTFADRLLDVDTSEPYEPEAAVIVDPPLRKSRSKQLAAAGEEYADYARDVVAGRVVVNGRERDRDDASAGGAYPGADVRPLL